MYTSRLLWWVFLPFLIISIPSLFQSNLVFKMPPKPRLNVHNFPRPPLLEKTPRHLQIKWNGDLIADTKDSYWVLETTHPPSKSYFCTLAPQSCVHWRLISYIQHITSHLPRSSHLSPRLRVSQCASGKEWQHTTQSPVPCQKRPPKPSKTAYGLTMSQPRASSQSLDTCLSMLVRGTAMLMESWLHHSQATFMGDG